MSDIPVDPQQAVDDARRALQEAEAEAASIAADAQPIEDAQEAPPPSPTSKHCANCGRHVVPLRRGNCPTCGRILPGAVFNFNRKGPASLVRRDEILTQILDEYKPRTVVHKLRCLHLASAYAQLESTTAGTTEFKRLIADSQTLVDELEAARKTDGASSAPPPIENLSNEELIARLEKLLAVAREAAPPVAPPVPASQPEAASAVSETAEGPRRASNAAGPDLSPAPKTAASPTALCVYCNSDPCVGESHESYYTLHPEAAQAREDERRNREFRLAFGLPVESDEPARPAPTDEERRQAALREELGWNEGIWNEQTGRRHQE